MVGPDHDQMLKLFTSGSSKLLFSWIFHSADSLSMPMTRKRLEHVLEERLLMYQELDNGR